MWNRLWRELLYCVFTRSFRSITSKSARRNYTLELLLISSLLSSLPYLSGSFSTFVDVVEPAFGFPFDLSKSLLSIVSDIVGKIHFILFIDYIHDNYVHYNN